MTEQAGWRMSAPRASGMASPAGWAGDARSAASVVSSSRSGRSGPHAGGRMASSLGLPA